MCSVLGRARSLIMISVLRALSAFLSLFFCWIRKVYLNFTLTEISFSNTRSHKIKNSLYVLKKFAFVFMCALCCEMHRSDERAGEREMPHPPVGHEARASAMSITHHHLKQWQSSSDDDLIKSFICIMLYTWFDSDPMRGEHATICQSLWITFK
jgi:hypothetical protein